MGGSGTDHTGLYIRLIGKRALPPSAIYLALASNDQGVVIMGK